MNKLFYIVGASGAGKDSLMNYCRNEIDGQLPIVFAHRYITRPVNAGAENHIYLTEKEFNLRQQHGLFALHWQSHGLYYGIGIEIENWLKRGLTVIINGSREYLPTALEKYPEIQPVLIWADAEVVKQRLYDRGREDAKSIAGRIARSEQLHLPDDNLIHIANNGELATAATELFNILSPSKNKQQVTI
jgi:ribose 1,5-bisphosphokinase